MKKAHVWLGLCLLLALAVTAQHSAAEASESSDAWSGKGLTAASQKAMEALTTGNCDAAWESLSSAKQGAVCLQKAKMEKFLNRLDLDDPASVLEFQEGFDLLDPQKKLGLKSPRDLFKLTDAQFFGLACGLLVVGDYLAKEPSSVWFAVDRAVGLHDPEYSSLLKKLDFTAFVGISAFETVDGGQLITQFTQDEGAWKLVEFTMKLGDFEIAFSEFLEVGADYDIEVEDLPVKGSPVEKSLNHLKDVARIEYSKTGAAPATLSDCGVDVRQRVVGSYTPRDKIYSSNTEGGLVMDPSVDGDPWILLLFSWASGEGSFIAFNSEDDLDAKLTRVFGE